MKKDQLRSCKQLKKALLELIEIKEYESITISEICSSAGFNRGTFYQNFENKDDLLQTIIDSKLQEMREILNKIRIDSIKSMSTSNSVYPLEPLFEFIHHNANFFKAVLKDNTINGFRKKMFFAYKSYLGDSLKTPLDNVDRDPLIDDLYLIFGTSSAMGVIFYLIHEGMHKSSTYITVQFTKIIQTRPHSLILGDMPFKKSTIQYTDEKDPRVDRTVRALKIAFLKLMKNTQYNRIKIKDITSLAEYNRSTFYAHYKAKDQLYYDILKDLKEGMISSLRYIVPKDEMNLNQNPSSPLINLFSFIYQHRTLLKVLYSEKKFIPGFYSIVYPCIVTFFQEELEGRIEVDTEIYCHYLTSTLMSVISFWMLNRAKYSPTYMAEIFEEILQKQPISNLVYN
ncbi:TetR/AcrR family transcriptional regulator [Neobacillus niacini]|uniref:TetR/AcrR family transcriptional regulator n=1 Tax=Neobacillus niacini TaxID=86668 RepID=UPI002FFE1554